MKIRIIVLAVLITATSLVSLADAQNNYNSQSQQILNQIMPTDPSTASSSNTLPNDPSASTMQTAPLKNMPIKPNQGTNPNISPSSSMPVQQLPPSFAQLSTQIPALINGSGSSTTTNDIERTFVYNTNSQYTVFCRVGYITTIYLQPGETVNYVAGGDVQRWTIDIGTAGTKDGNVECVVIKPFDINIKTNLMVNTNLHSYQFQLDSTTNQYNAVVRFNYPQGLAPAEAAIALNKYSNPSSNNPALMNYNYNWNNKNLYWAPLEVYDNGHQTFIHMKDGLQQQDAPVLMAQDPSTGQLQVINYRVDGNYYIVDQLITTVVLRLNNQDIIINKDGYFPRNQYDNYIYIR